MVEVGPGVVVTAEEANFIFERLHRIKEGEMEVLGIRAPSSMKINDLCTLSCLLLNKDFEEAKELVAECMSSCQRTNLPGSESSGMKIKSCSLPHSPMEYLKKNPGEGWRRERKKTRAALKDEKTYIHVPLMKKKSQKLTKAGKEQLSLRAKGAVQENVEQVDPGLGDADPTPGSGSLKVSPLSYALGRIYNMIDQEKLRRQGQATLDGLDEFAEAQEAKAKRRQRQKEEVDPGLGDADPTPGFEPLEVSPLSYALSQQNLYHDCSGEPRGKGHCQHSQPPGRAHSW